MNVSEARIVAVAKVLLTAGEQGGATAAEVVLACERICKTSEAVALRQIMTNVLGEQFARQMGLAS